jgi:hypothetical protein
MGMEKEPIAEAEKIKYFNKLDETIGLIFYQFPEISSFMSMEPLLLMWSGPHWKDYSESRIQ